MPVLAAKVRERYKEFTRLRAAARSQRSVQMFEQLDSHYQQLMDLRLEEYHNRHLAESDFGEDDAFLRLALGPCVSSEPTTEKELKGGTSNSVSRTYVFVLCPFRNVTQQEPAHVAWVMEQEAAKMGGHEYLNEASRASIEPRLGSASESESSAPACSSGRRSRELRSARSTRSRATGTRCASAPPGSASSARRSTATSSRPSGAGLQ